MTAENFFDGRDFIIICGHYGCGKTNLALNLAVDFARKGEKVTLVDLDLVNPYFRSSDYPELLREYGIELLASSYAHSNLDIPSIPTEMYSMFARSGRIIVDVGGDDAGATALGRFARMINEKAYTMMYVVNRNRALSTTAEEAVELLGEIREASRLEPQYIVNNSHLMEQTDSDIIKKGYDFAREVSEKSGLPLAFTAVSRGLADEAGVIIPDIYPVDVLVKKVWD